MPNDKKRLTVGNQLLNDVEMAMNDHNFDMEWYLDVSEEKTTFLCDPNLTGEYDENEKLERQIEEDKDGRFIPIPARPSHEGWNQMERFILSLDDQDEQTRDLLMKTIRGAGAFGKFKDALHRIGLHEQWYEFRDREDRRHALNWLRSQGLITNGDIDKGMQLYKEMLAKRKQRASDIGNMTKGKRVKCSDVHGHGDKLTVGKTYEVLDEQKQHLNIKVRDNRGKLVWLPKSHFQLQK